MKRFTMVFAIALLLVALGAIPAFAQSSGNFSAGNFPATCAITSGTATSGVSNLTGPTCDVLEGSSPTGKGGPFCNLMTAGIKTSNGSGVTLLVRPSLVTGLFTETNVTSSNKNSSGITTATADVGIQVCVIVDNLEPAKVLPPQCVIYDQRFQQLSTNLFATVTACSNLSCCNTGTCFNPCCEVASGGTGVCTSGTTCATTSAACTGTPVTGVNCVTDTCTAQGPGADACCFTSDCASADTTCGTPCNIDLILSTLAAHSFDFVVPVGGGFHTLTAEWGVFGSTSTGGTIGACAGPGVLTIQQVKVFNNSGSLPTTVF